MPTTPLRLFLLAVGVSILLVGCDSGTESPDVGFEATIESGDGTKQIRGRAGAADAQRAGTQFTGVLRLIPSLLPDDAALSDSLDVDSLLASPPDVQGALIVLSARDDDGYGESIGLVLPSDGMPTPGEYRLTSLVDVGLSSDPAQDVTPDDLLPTAYYTTYTADAFAASLAGSGAVRIESSTEERLRGTFRFTTLAEATFPLSEGRLPLLDSTYVDSVRVGPSFRTVNGSFTAATTGPLEQPPLPGF